MSDAAVNFWQTEAGLLDRLGLLSDQIQLGTFNNAAKVYFTAVGVTDLTISGDINTNTCEWCALHVGQTYHYGMFMPILPKHIKCIHFYDIGRGETSTYQSLPESQ